MSSTVLVTGASGFLGLNLVEQLLGRGDTVIGVSHDRAPPDALSDFAALPGRLVEITADLTRPFDFASLIATHRVDAVINGAAMTPGPGADPRLARKVLDLNVVSSQRLLEAARDGGVTRFFQPSSTSIYGDAVFGDHPPCEDDPGAPDGLYAVSKYVVERLALSFGERYGMPVVAGRISSLFGPWERDTGVRDLLSPHLQLVRLARAGVEAVLEPDAARDWSYARDVAKAMLCLTDQRADGVALCNISCGESWPFHRWAEHLAARRPGFRWRFAAPDEQSNIAYHGPRGRRRQPLDVGRLKACGAHDPIRSCDAALHDYAEWLETRG